MTDLINPGLIYGLVWMFAFVALFTFIWPSENKASLDTVLNVMSVAAIMVLAGFGGIAVFVMSLS